MYSCHSWLNAHPFFICVQIQADLSVCMPLPQGNRNTPAHAFIRHLKVTETRLATLNDAVYDHEPTFAHQTASVLFQALPNGRIHCHVTGWAQEDPVMQAAIPQFAAHFKGSLLMHSNPITGVGSGMAAAAGVHNHAQPVDGTLPSGSGAHHTERVATPADRDMPGHVTVVTGPADVVPHVAKRKKLSDYVRLVLHHIDIAVISPLVTEANGLQFCNGSNPNLPKYWRDLWVLNKEGVCGCGNTCSGLRELLGTYPTDKPLPSWRLKVSMYSTAVCTAVLCFAVLWGSAFHCSS